MGLLDGWLVVGSPFTSVVKSRDGIFEASADPDIGHFHYDIAGFWITQSLSVGNLVLNDDPFGLAEIDVRNNVLGMDRFWLSISVVGLSGWMFGILY